MKKIFRFLPKGIITLGSLLFFLGCAAKTASILPDDEDNSAPFVVIAETMSSPIDSATLKPQKTPFADLISEAELFCSEQLFIDADSLLRSIVKLLGAQNPEDNIPVDNYFDEIARIYIDLMPTDFPIPNEIISTVFQQKLYRSLDSVSMTTGDSLSLQQMLGCKGMAFDVPIIWNLRVQKALQLYITRRRETVNTWLTRSAYYLPVMKKVFEDSGLPQDLAYLPLIESSFNPKAYSPAHASGIWQFIPSTGKNYGLRNNYWIDERRDPLKATIAASRYLKKLFGLFDNWHLSLGAYNCGEGGMGRSMARCGTNDYWQLKLPGETMNYVPLYLAALTITKNPECFGFTPPSTPRIFSLDTVLLSECLDMKDIADGIGVDFDTLKSINPHILHWCTPPDINDITFYLPGGYAQPFKDFVANIPEEKKVKWYRYKIKRGDNITTIAKHFRMPVEPIKSVNRLKNNKLIAGHYLFIPIPVNSSLSIATIEQQVAEEVSVASKPKTPGKGQKVIYQVKKGETVWGISELFDVMIDDIYLWNGLSSKAKIKPGQTLEIYKDDKIPSASPGATTTVNAQQDQNTTKKTENQTGYTVQQGDTPYSIAHKFGMSVDELTLLNNLNKENLIIHIGQNIAVTSNNQKVEPATVARKSVTADINIQNRYRVSDGDNLYRIARIFNISIENLAIANNMAEGSTIRTGDILIIPPTQQQQSVSAEKETPIVFYEVKVGDNLWRIANSFGIPVQNLCNYNNLNSDSILMPGDTLKVYRTVKM